jgi:hypothetical protein
MCKETLVGGGGKVNLKDMHNQLVDDGKLHFTPTNRTIIVSGVAVKGDHHVLSGVTLELVIKFYCITAVVPLSKLLAVGIGDLGPLCKNCVDQSSS